MGILKKSTQIEEDPTIRGMERFRGVYALGQYIPMSVHKARRVIDQIRGRSYEETLMILELMPYRACYPILKLVYSAAANAIHNKDFNKAALRICKAVVNKGTTMKKLKPRARGRSYLIKKPTCHITIVLRDTSCMDEFRKNIDAYSKKEKRKVLAAANSIRKFDELVVRLLIKGEMQLD